MNDNIIFLNDYIKMYSQADQIFLETLKPGLPADQLNNLISSHPEVEIGNFLTFKNALKSITSNPIIIGKLKERIFINVTENKMKALVIFNIPKDELENANLQNLMKETIEKLNSQGIIYGINYSIFSQKFASNTPHVIAEGTASVNGTDSILKLYEIKEPQPQVNGDDKVDFYELKLINRVRAGDWLGERLDATDGTPGKNIFGEILNPVKGKTIPLSYDKNSVTEEKEKGKTVLYSKIDGAVNIINGKLTVLNHIEIDGDVDFKTGNIKFDGFVTIKGTVADGFSVEATKDIEINGDLGLGNVKGIVSTQGSIFIKGGILSRGKVEIKAAKNIYTKFVDDSVIIAGDSIHIGYYCVNSKISAKEVIIDSSSGHIIGGCIKAEIRVSAPIIGSKMDKKTLIEVTGFNREHLKEELSDMTDKISKYKNEQMILKQTVSQLESHKPMGIEQKKELNRTVDRIICLRDEIKTLEDNKKNINGYLKAKGEGEICVSKIVYPRCTLIIKRQTVEISQVTSSITYYSIDGEIKTA